MPLTVAEFDYPLPSELIAQHPLPERAASRLLLLDGTTIEDRRFSDLQSLLDTGDLLVVNDTRVMRARLFATKATGGRVELLVERLAGGGEVLAHLRASHKPAAGARLVLEDGTAIEVMGREGELFRLCFPDGLAVADWLERHGHLPLPPYIERPADADDAVRYQTVYARETGSVAAPTAGLHFDEPLLARLARRGVQLSRLTLHVGAGTFQPLRVDNVAEHRMHRERYTVPPETVRAIAEARRRGARVVAVGTTTLRALESAAAGGTLTPGERETELFITPGYRFRVVDALVTNFHLPRSTLLMLVCAFGGLEATRRAYAHAVAARYRFFSYGDAMFVRRAAS